ncbi:MULTISPECIES: polysaccharide deacetylase family protein [unclassified Microbacterium]|uniref:polysaccharide deacetylase family protein n=1 Tax=unclassified Microbacterium TaxID=2609290 RepID=UPI00301A37F7
MTSRRTRSARLLAGILGATLLLSACAPDAVSGWKPRQWTVSGTIVATPTPEAPGKAATMDMRLSNDEVGIDARWAALPGDAAFTAAVEQVVRETVAAQAARSGRSYRPMVHPAGAGLGARGCTPEATSAPAAEVLDGRTGTVVVCTVVLARGPFFAERLRILTASADGVASDTSTTLYTNVSTGEIATEAELFTDPASLWPAYIDTLRRDAGSLSLLPVADPTDEQLDVLRAALLSAHLTDGEVIIPVPDDLSATELDGLAAWRKRSREKPESVALSATQAADALTPFAQALLAAEGDFTGTPSAGSGFEHTPCDLVPCMALTLDDGPSKLTPQFLDVLRDEQSAATFFMLGRNAQSYPDTVRRVAAEGHQIGNHTWDHSYLTKLTPEQIQDQLGRTATLLRDLSGQQVGTFRPPGGFVDDEVVAAAGEPAILWSVDTRDWAGPADDDLARYAIDTPEVSSIMLMHDIQAVSARVFPRVVAGLRDRGFSLVTIDALFGGAVPGGIVRHGPVV